MAAAGCNNVSDLGNSIDSATDCDQVCSRYADCFDSNYDTAACRGRCEDNADTVSNYADTLDTCENCMDDKSCTEATFNCSAPCSNVVP